MRTFSGHSGFVFAIHCLNANEVASGGDDCCVKIWDISTGNCKQTIQLPRTVWAVTSNGLGDLLVGTEDYKVRTFTRDINRIASEEELKEFENDLKSQVKQGAETSEFANAPDESAQATTPGKTEGDIQVFKRNGVPCAFMWKMAE